MLAADAQQVVHEHEHREAQDLHVQADLIHEFYTVDGPPLGTTRVEILSEALHANQITLHENHAEYREQAGASGIRQRVALLVVKVLDGVLERLG